jgi:hypothetical protein
MLELVLDYFHGKKTGMDEFWNCSLIRELFMNGPLEFRIVEEMPENPRDVIPIQWVKFLDANQKTCILM